NNHLVFGSLYVYEPNKSASIFFAVAFGLSAMFHVFQCFYFKAWNMLGLHAICAVILAAGYGIREWSTYHFMYLKTDKLPLSLFITNQVMIMICPPLLELANYFVLNRIFSYIPFLAPIRPGRVATIFGSLMGLVEGLNGAGVALASNAGASDATKQAGHYLTLVALCLQVVVILTFFLMAFTFHARCLRAKVYPRAVRTPLVVLYASMIVIFVRCVYRLVEFALGSTTVDLRDRAALGRLSPLVRYEVFFYVFEASLMLLNSALWNGWHPGRYLPREARVHLADDGRTEVLADKEAHAQERHMGLATLADFGIVGIITKAVKAIRKRNNSNSRGRHARVGSENQELNSLRIHQPHDEFAPEEQ
ncbi:hypothetical protein PG984_010304, partial [Apiospora sp. TS-2023a]